MISIANRVIRLNRIGERLILMLNEEKTQPSAACFHDSRLPTHENADTRSITLVLCVVSDRWRIAVGGVGTRFVRRLFGCGWESAAAFTHVGIPAGCEFCE